MYYSNKEELDDRIEVGGQCGPRDLACRTEELEDLGIEWGRMEEAFEEGQGPHRAVEPVMMMNVGIRDVSNVKL
jgi:hypothetical protein